MMIVIFSLLFLLFFFYPIFPSSNDVELIFHPLIVFKKVYVMIALYHFGDSGAITANPCRLGSESVRFPCAD